VRKNPFKGYAPLFPVEIGELFDSRGGLLTSAATMMMIMMMMERWAKKQYRKHTFSHPKSHV